MKNKAGIFVLGLLLTPLAQADLYVELGLEGGGQELVGTSSGDNLYAGGGIKLAAGIQNPVGPAGNASLRLAVGYLSDSVDAVNGHAEMDTFTFDALYMIDSGPHRFGFGPTVHMAPQYRDNVSGYAPVEIEFDNALGFVLQYGLNITPGFEIGARVTSIDYQNETTTLDASSVGVYLSNGF